MKANKLTLLALLAIVAAGFVLTGCSGGGESEEAASMTGKADPAATPATPGEGGGKGGMTPPSIKEDGK